MKAKRISFVPSVPSNDRRVARQTRGGAEFAAARLTGMNSSRIGSNLSSASLQQFFHARRPLTKGATRPQGARIRHTHSSLIGFLRSALAGAVGECVRGSCVGLDVTFARPLSAPIDRD